MIGTIVGLDLSLRQSGVAVVYHDTTEKVATDLVTSEGHRDDTWHQRFRRIGAIAGELRLIVPPTREQVLVVMEGPSLRSTGAGGWDIAGLWWLTYRSMTRGGHHIAVVPPSVRAKWATGSGAADKAAVASAATRMWGTGFDNTDEADAAVLARMGAVHLGWLTGPRADVLAKAQWPPLPEDDDLPDESEDGS